MKIYGFVSVDRTEEISGEVLEDLTEVIEGTVEDPEEES